jgi:UDP-N-acetylmuramoyl-L-alanyl-D-glutamate--2,6-diaminopimelate ligase
MMLRELLQDCEYREDNVMHDTNIPGVAYDSRQVKEGYLFVAVKGEKFDGHNFIQDAIEKGARVVIHEHEIPESVMQNPYIYSVLSFISVKDSRRALACISNNFYKRPSESLTLIGVTGTNGKTTTTYILKSVLESWGKNIGLIGTIQYMIRDRIYPAIHTTPESLEFQALLREMYSSGCTHVITEVSSHALAQYRADSAVFNTAVFTNLTRDHLDFHKTMENYFNAKERLFRELLKKNGTAVINLDDPYGRRLISSLRSDSERRILTYGIEAEADITAHDIHTSFQGLQFGIFFNGNRYNIMSPLIGIPNVYNILAAVGASISLGIPWQIIQEGIEKAGNVAGRFEKVDEGQDFLCIIDYAHTEDALERLIYTARELIKESEISSQILPKSFPRIITVFGCGGDRDCGKRPGMGAIATRLSDVVIITSDNPRSEEPLRIIKDIESGTVRKNYIIEPDRKEAISKAVDMAKKGDIVLIAGKGHEDYQEIKGIRHPFSDRDVLKKTIKNTCRMQDVQ